MGAAGMQAGLGQLLLIDQQLLFAKILRRLTSKNIGVCHSMR
jgi:hypothetical protein